MPAEAGIKWSEQVEDAIDIDLSHFELILAEQPVLFNTTNIFDFLCQLNENGFKRLTRDPSDLLSNVYRFQNDSFKRNELELSTDMTPNAQGKHTSTGKLTAQMKRTNGGQKSSIDRQMAKVVLDKIKLKTSIKMFLLENELKKKKTELSANLFANPGTGTSNFQQNSYVGFYGFLSDEAVTKFFGTYLPMFEPDNGSSTKG